jgi:Tfp pilus assembly protein PilO
MKRTGLMYLAAGAVLAAVWFVFLLQPSRHEQAALQAESEMIQGRLDNFRTTMMQLPGYVRTEQELASVKRELNARLYAREEILELMRLLEREAEKRNLVLVDITPPVEELLELGNNAKTDAPSFLNLRLELQGGYEDFGRYVGLLESSPFFRGANYCRVVSASEVGTQTQYILAFKALLGSMEAAT